MCSESFLSAGPAQITDNTFGTVGIAGLAYITPVEDQPMMGIEQELRRYTLQKFSLND